MITLEVNGTDYDNFVSASVGIRLDALSNTFTFEAVAPQNAPLPFKGGDPCKIRADGELVLTGFIEVISVSYDSESHTINVSGRDKTGDLLDSTIDKLDDFYGENLTLKALIEAVIKSIGSDIKVIDEANPTPFNGAEDISAPEPGDNAFSFIEAHARKKQVLLTSNANGDIIITKNSGEYAEGAVQHIIGADDNNVLSANFNFDTTGRYNLYKMASSLNPVALNFSGDTGVDSISNQSGGISDDEIRAGRQLVLVSETTLSDENCAKRAKWEADIRKARGLLYSAKVNGFRIADNLWQINRLYQIVDDYVGKKETMLCNSVSFNWGPEGSDTDLGFVGKKAYSLFVEDTTSEVASNVA